MAVVLQAKVNKMNHNEIKNITIVGGAGMMGVGIAQVFASKGLNVTIYTRSLTNCTAIDDMSKQLDLCIKEGLLDSEAKQSTLQNVEVTADFQYAVSKADLVIESVPEKLLLKQQIFRDIEQYCSPNCIIATNTSVISVTEIAIACVRKERILGTHFWNPAVFIPLVEVIRTEYTDDDVFECIFSLLSAVGKKPAKCMKDVPGFLANRLQHALWREAFYMLDQGIADAKTIDECIKNSFGFRLPQLAPFENADMVGTDLALNIHNYIFQHLYSGTEPSQTLKVLVETGELGFKSGSGFQSWNDDSIAKSKSSLSKYLIDQTKYRNSTSN